jgi:hypothetical protein
LHTCAYTICVCMYIHKIWYAISKFFKSSCCKKNLSSFVFCYFVFLTGSHFVAQAASNSHSSCLNLPSAGIPDMYYHTQLKIIFVINYLILHQYHCNLYILFRFQAFNQRFNSLKLSREILLLSLCSFERTNYPSNVIYNISVYSYFTPTIKDHQEECLCLPSVSEYKLKNCYSSTSFHSSHRYLKKTFHCMVWQLGLTGLTQSPLWINLMLVWQLGVVKPS